MIEVLCVLVFVVYEGIMCTFEMCNKKTTQIFYHVLFVEKFKTLKSFNNHCKHQETISNINSESGLVSNRS